MADSMQRDSLHDEAHALARGVARLNRRLRQERRSDLTPTQLSVLGTMLQLGPATPGAIATRERVQPPTLTRMLHTLEEAGLIVRAPHPDDGRQLLVSMSDQGHAVLEDERRRRDDWLAEQLDHLTPGQRSVLHEAAGVLEQIAES